MGTTSVKLATTLPITNPLHLHCKMALPRSATTLRAAVTSCPIWNRPIDALHLVPAPSSPILTFLRHATHKAQGSVNGARDGPGKRLGAKKTGGELGPTISNSLSSLYPLRSNDSHSNIIITSTSPRYTRHKLTSPPQSNTSSRATSSSANAARTGSQARTSAWAATTPSTPSKPGT